MNMAGVLPPLPVILSQRFFVCQPTNERRCVRTCQSCQSCFHITFGCFWHWNAEYNKEQEEEIKADDALARMSEEEKDAKIKALTKKLKASKKEEDPSKEKVNDK